MSSMKAFLPLCLLLGACATVAPPPFVPYNYYEYPPPKLSGRTYTPVSLRCIDGSNIFVHCNDSWWWGTCQRMDPHRRRVVSVAAQRLAVKGL
jgi:hypothetical protein